MPWCDAVYGCDGPWWRSVKGLPEYRGLKFTRDLHARKAFPDLRLVGSETPGRAILLDDGASICNAGNSGMQALNLAIKFGARRVALVGFDMNDQYGLHWFGRHRGGLNNPSRHGLAKWREILDSQAPRLNAAGIEVVNCSPISALTAFPKMTLAEALSHFGILLGRNSDG